MQVKYLMVTYLQYSKEVIAGEYYSLSLARVLESVIIILFEPGMS